MKTVKKMIPESKDECTYILCTRCGYFTLRGNTNPSGMACSKVWKEDEWQRINNKHHFR